MKCKLVLDDWRQVGSADSIYSTELGCELSMGDLHSGTTFDVELAFADPYIQAEIVDAMEAHGAYPVFRLIVPQRGGEAK